MSKTDRKTFRALAKPAGTGTALALLAPFCGLGAAALDASPAQAISAAQTYQIPPGAVAAALNRLADASGAVMVYDSQLAWNRTTKGLKGAYTLDEAVGKLLVGTGLDYRLAPGGKSVAIMVAQNATGTQSDAGAVALPEVTAEGAEGARARTSGSELGAGWPGGPNDPAAYAKQDAVTATKTDAPIMQTPAAITVVPQQVLRDQQVITIDDALQNVSGVYAVPVAGLQSGFSVRGFENYQYYLNGVPVYHQNTPISEETADIQQIEVLKGPASILYGRIEPGGLVNLVSKMPLKMPYASLQQQFGSYDFYRTTLDMTGPVTTDGNLLYRFNMAYENAGSFREFDYNRRIFVSPRFHWEPTQDTQMDFYLRYINGVAPLDIGTPVLLNTLGQPMGIAPVPISRNYGEPGSAINNYNVRFGFNLTHQFNPDWSLTQRFDANYINAPGTPIVPYGPIEACGITCPVQRLVNNPHIQAQIYYSSLELTGHFDTFGFGHTLLAGVDFYLDQQKFTRSFSFAVPDIDLYNPIHTGSPLWLLGNPDLSFVAEQGQSWYGFYLQDRITLPYNFHLLLGVRNDNASQFTTQAISIPQPTTVNSLRNSESAVKPRIGLLWQPIPQLSLFGDYVEGFGVSNLVNGAGLGDAVLPPQQSRQWEAGVKFDLLDQRLTATLAWFDIIKTNIPSPSSDPALARAGVLVATGAALNRGIDFDITGQVLPEVKIIGSFAYINSKIVADNYRNLGNRLYGVPELGGSFWAVYEPLWDPVRGLALGAGFVARSNTEYDNANSFTLPGYTTVNLMARYAFNYDQLKLSFQVNVNNLLNETYYLPGPTPGTPRSILGSIKMEW